MEERFEVVSQQNVDSIAYKVLRDKQTGVMYLYVKDYNSGGLTVLLDKEGKPLTSFKVNVK